MDLFSKVKNCHQVLVMTCLKLIIYIEEEDTCMIFVN